MKGANRVLTFLIFAIVCIGCSGTSNTHSPESAPLSNAATAGAGIASVDPAVGLKIGAPYTLVVVDPATAALLRGIKSEWPAGGRDVLRNGTKVGWIMVHGLIVAGLASGASQADIQDDMKTFGDLLGAKLQETTIGSTLAWTTGSNNDGSAMFYRAGDTLVQVGTPGSPDVTRAIAEALIAANH